MVIKHIFSKVLLFLSCFIFLILPFFFSPEHQLFFWRLLTRFFHVLCHSRRSCNEELTAPASGSSWSRVGHRVARGPGSAAPGAESQRVCSGKRAVGVGTEIPNAELESIWKYPSTLILFPVFIFFFLLKHILWLLRKIPDLALFRWNLRCSCWHCSRLGYVAQTYTLWPSPGGVLAELPLKIRAVPEPNAFVARAERF